VLAGLSAFTWRRRSATSGAALTVLLAAAALWVLAAAAEHLTPTLAGKLLATKIQYLGILVLPPASLCTVLNYLGLARWHKPFLTIAIPLALVCYTLIASDHIHHWMWPDIDLDTSGAIPLLKLAHGPGFWAINAVSHGQLFLAFALFFVNSLKNWRVESVLVCLGFAAPWIANLIYISGLSPVDYLDITPFGLIVTGICFTISFHGAGSIFSTVNLAHRDIVESIADLILVVDERKQILSANRSAREILAEHPLPASIDVMLEHHPLLLRCLQEGPQAHHKDVELKIAGHMMTYDIRAVHTVDAFRGNRATVYVLRDATSQRAFENDLHRHRQQLRQVIDLIPHPIYARDAQGRFLLANDSCARAYGFSGEEMEGLVIGDVHRDVKEVARINAEDRRVMNNRESLSTEDIYRSFGKAPRTYKTTKVPFMYDDSDAAGVVAMSIDVTKERERENLLKVLASTDPLTNLPNRREFDRVLDKSLSRAIMSGHRVALLSLDLDHFKMVNENHGHPVGDEVLNQVAGRLRDNLRYGDQIATPPAAPDQVTVARLGGDEFMVLLPTVADSMDAARVARRLIVALDEPFEIGSDRLQLGASIGIAIGPDDGDIPETLVRRCDQALTSVKRVLRGSFEFYNAELSAVEERRHAIEQGLRRALDRDEFRMHFQPICDTQTSQLCGAEALLRWDSAELGVVAPDEFIPVAEESGLVVRIGEVVLRSVCEQIALWRARGFIVPVISINLSARQLVDIDFREQVEPVFKHTGVKGSDLEFELTEGSMLTESRRVDETLDWLQGLGASLALDDFGTGFSSLSHLRRFSFQRLKIDRSFVLGLGVSSEDERLVRGVIALAHRLNIDTVAEGVETQQQLEILRGEGCKYVQGYFLGRPAPPDVFEHLLEMVELESDAITS
jgi:diguanylate cyclase (GGDEF)-like protein/PAS domain S-box-containing protein